MLGPLLFLLFINDLPNIGDKNLIELFVDDISYLCSQRNKEDLIECAQEMFNKFLNWFNKNILYLNIDKTVFIHFTPRTKNYEESLLIKKDKKSIHQVVETKFLGLFLENNLGWNVHIDSVCGSLSTACYALYRLRELTNFNIMKTYYFAHVYSKIKYGIIFWGCSSPSLRVFRIQKRAVRTLAGSWRYAPCKQLFMLNGLLIVPCI